MREKSLMYRGVTDIDLRLFYNLERSLEQITFQSYMKIKDIYNYFTQESNRKDDVSMEVQKKIQDILIRKKEQMDWKEYEQYADQIYAVAAIAEESGFINGFRHAVLLMAECYGASRDITSEP